MRLVIQCQLECHNIQIEVVDNTARVTKVIVVIRSAKHVMMNIQKAYSQVTVFILKKIGSNTNGECSVVLIKHSVEILRDEASIS